MFGLSQLCCVVDADGAGSILKRVQAGGGRWWWYVLSLLEGRRGCISGGTTARLSLSVVAQQGAEGKDIRK